MRVRYFDFCETDRQEYALPHGWEPFQVETFASIDGMTVRVWARKA